ncbi:SdrD B-like domain-containing protein, partial [Chloroflexus sp.]|uniref:SdrD B-like domain-containing protein n=1 Tax=Chloroflexus sp. TaxID=1904827 RepID=UPI00404A5307
GSTLPEEGGIFVFPSLQLGTTYQVVISNSQFASGALLFGAANSPNETGGDVGSPDGVPTGDVTGPTITLTEKTNTRTDQRFGFYKGVVGDFVWLDDDSDGLQEAGEIGINGVTVFVDDGRGGGIANDGIRNGGEIATVTANNPNTGQPGYYLFDDLPLGSRYRIVLDPANFQPGGALVGLGNSTGTEDTNGNGDRYVYRDSSELSATSAEDTGVDFGMIRASIGNLVFEDANGDGVFNSGEAVIPNVTVRAYRASDNTLLGTATSDGSGTYTIEGLPAEPIYATFDLSTATGYSGFVGSLQPSGATIDPTETTYPDYSDLISNVGGSVWRTDIFTPTLDTANNGIDAGFYRPVRIVVRVFGETRTINNTLESGEPGISGVTVQVTGPEAQTLTTNDDGEAIFDLRPGSYTVTVTTPTGYRASPGNTGSSSFSNLNSQAIVNADFGYYRPGSISGLTFFDTNADGLASGEPRLRNVTVELVDTSNTVLATTTTATNGTYTFNNILPADYTVRFTNPDTGNYVFITGGDSDVTTAGNVATSSTNTLTVRYNGSLTNIDAGFRGQTTVSGRIFEDNNADNLQDAGDTDLSGATVTLTVTANLTNLVATYQATLNTSTPTYAFNNLPGGNGVTYTVTFTPPSSAYIPSDANVGTNDAIDSDGPVVTITDPAAGGTITNVDQGYFRNVTITARVFREPSAGRNNRWDSGEDGISGVRVFLEQNGTPVLTGTTTTGGLVTFSARPGSYDLNVDESSTALSGLLPS